MVPLITSKMCFWNTNQDSENLKHAIGSHDPKFYNFLSKIKLFPLKSVWYESTVRSVNRWNNNLYWRSNKGSKTMLKAGNSIINSIKRALRHDSDEDVRGKQLILSFHNRFRLRQFKQVLGKSYWYDSIIDRDLLNFKIMEKYFLQRTQPFEVFWNSINATYWQIII